MNKSKCVARAGVVLLSISFLTPGAMAADMAGIMMQDGKMMMMQGGKATGPMDHEMTMSDGHKVMPDGTMTMNDGKDMRMQEGQMMTMDGRMMEGTKPADHDKGMMGGKGMKMEGMGK